MSKIVTCPLIASCYMTLPLGCVISIWNSKVELLISPEDGAPIYLVVQAEVLRHSSSLSLYPQAVCQHFLSTVLLNISLNHWASLSITVAPPCSDPLHLLFVPIALVFKSISLLPYDLLSTKQKESSFYILLSPFKVTHWFSLVVRKKSLSLTLVYKAVWSLAPTTSETSAPTTLPHP